MSNDIYYDEILNGRIPVDKVIETENVLAFHHTSPFYPVQIMVVPKKHIFSLIDMENQSDEMPFICLRRQCYNLRIIRC